MKNELKCLSKMENETSKNLKTLIEAITHSGSNVIDEEIMKQVKKICKSSQSNIPIAYNLVLGQLKKKNSQIRLAAFQICRELFKRSGLFRENVLKDLNLIFELTSEINSTKKLPPPASSAERLKTLAVSTLNEWVKEFGEAYKKLKVAYNYFRTCKQVDFETLEVGDSPQQVVQSEQQRHIRMVNEEKVKRVLEEFKNNESEIELTVTTLSNCLSLLLPPVEEFFIPEVNLNEPSTSKTFITGSNESSNSKSTNSLKCDETIERCVVNNGNSLREFGIPLDYNLSLEVNMGEKFKVIKTEENSSVIENAKDSVRLICNRYLPMVKKWIKIYSKYSNSSSTDIKKIIDLKEKLEKILNKHNSIVIDDLNCNIADEDSSDDEFQEVNKEGYEDSVDFSEMHLLDCLQEKSKIVESTDKLKSSSEEKKEPVANTSEEGSSGMPKTTSETLDRKTKLLSIAPKLPYDIDLYHWEDEHLSTPTLISSKIDVDKFWGSAESDDIHEIPNPDGVAALRTRVIEYSGVFEPVKWACRAPLPSGKLCPRKDRFKCPFHGKIVARDEMGNIQDTADQNNTDQTTSESTATVPDFQDPEFLRDIQAATGVDLKIPDRKGKKRRSEKVNLTHKKMRTSAAALRIVEAKKLPGLIDVVKRQNNAYTRLSKKIFNRSSLRRVSAVLNKLDRKKFIDKYGDQFNYL